MRLRVLKAVSDLEKSSAASQANYMKICVANNFLRSRLISALWRASGRNQQGYTWALN